MRRICFVGVDNYLMLNSASTGAAVNGEAVQQVLLARAFRDLGFEVSTVVASSGGKIDEVIDSIRVLSAFERGSGYPILRFLHPKMTGLFRCLKEVDADIYFQSPAAGLTGLTAAFCKRHSKIFIYRVASDVDCIPGKQLIELWRDRRLFEFGLRNAHLVATQSQYQQRLLDENYGLKSIIANMAVEEPIESLDGPKEIDILWISNLKSVKRVDRLLNIAAQLPEVRFAIIGGVVIGEEDYFAEAKSDAAKLPNVEFMGGLSYADVNQQIAKSKILVNTSEIEGFPNTFLQAWIRKVPVVSFFDPDDIIVRQIGRAHV